MTTDKQWVVRIFKKGTLWCEIEVTTMWYAFHFNYISYNSGSTELLWTHLFYQCGPSTRTPPPALRYKENIKHLLIDEGLSEWWMLFLEIQPETSTVPPTVRFAILLVPSAAVPPSESCPAVENTGWKLSLLNTHRNTTSGKVTPLSTRTLCDHISLGF